MACVVLQMFYHLLMPDNYFLALMPPADCLNDIFAAQKLVHGGKLMNAPRLHITMYLLDPVARDLNASLDRLQGLISDASLPAARVIFDQVVGASGTGLLLGTERMEGLFGLRDKLVALFEPKGIAQWPNYRFNPHMTLMRGKVEKSQIAIDPISWDAREIALVHSFVGQSRYEIMATWPLVREKVE